ncbi:MAG: cytochrome C [Chlorobiaceae bacterium]|nr:cytochrome C [Chlorobiaceae bacterium]MBA4308891.1 cytochrome C [Chlorobiaceae bacterium]
MKIQYIYTGLVILLVGFLANAGINASSKEDEKTNKEIIKFSHAIHKELSDCASCHTNAAASVSLNDRLLPEKSVCATCHDVNDSEDCTKCHFEDVYEPLVKKSSELIFNHKIHMEDSKTTCETCHKGVSEVDYSFHAAEANPSMALCYTCHSGVSVAANDCQTCHTSTVNLIPQDHKSGSFMKTHKFKSTAQNANCAMCHDNSFCESCHAGTTMLDATNTATNFYTPYSPHTYVDNTKQQNINRVHDFNYRYTHGIDAKGKSAQCQTCHQTETFCVECHSTTGGDYALAGMLPRSHTLPNFFTIGVGSGGGEHAILAKRDIENCASCHDVQGADANCITCHVDNDGIKGTNPKTHKSNFMSAFDNGDWHNDRGSVCFSCHTDANARPDGIKGLGFCGYCHK